MLWNEVLKCIQDKWGRVAKAWNCVSNENLCHELSLEQYWEKAIDISNEFTIWQRKKNVWQSSWSLMHSSNGWKEAQRDNYMRSKMIALKTHWITSIILTFPNRCPYSSIFLPKHEILTKIKTLRKKMTISEKKTWKRKSTLWSELN